MWGNCSLVSRPFRFRVTILAWNFDRICRLMDLMGGKREGLAQFANLPFLAPYLSFQKQYILNIYISVFVTLMKYIHWQAQVRVNLCDSFHTSIRIKLQDKTKLANFARPSPAV